MDALPGAGTARRSWIPCRPRRWCGAPATRWSRRCAGVWGALPRKQPATDERRVALVRLEHLWWALLALILFHTFSGGGGSGAPPSLDQSRPVAPFQAT